MPTNLYAAIDCGTNTFHLLIVASDGQGGLRNICRRQVYVYLAEDGIGQIGEKPFRRGQDALREFRELMDQHGVTHYRAMGTAALRTAANAPFFLEHALQDHQIRIEVIDGDEEARLICEGVRLAMPMPEPVVIMDIGGGSVEYIVADAQKIFWKQSFPIGGAVLYSRFFQTEPIAPADLAAMTAYLEETLAPMQAAAAVWRPVALVGASGAFDVLEDMLVRRHQDACFNELPRDGVQRIHEQLIGMSLEERLRVEKLPQQRAKLFNTALVLIEVSLRLSNCHRLLYSEYAMKQGILKEMMD